MKTSKKKNLTTSKNIPLVLKKFISSAKDHCKTHKHPCDYAKELIVTEDYLNKQFKKYFSKPIHIFLDKILIAKAKKLIKESNMSVKEIATELNFNNADYFRRFFKKYTGKTAKEFKKMN